MSTGGAAGSWECRRWGCHVTHLNFSADVKSTSRSRLQLLSEELGWLFSHYTSVMRVWRVRWPRFLDTEPQSRSRRLSNLEPHVGQAWGDQCWGAEALSSLSLGPLRGLILQDRSPGSLHTNLRRKGRIPAVVIFALLCVCYCKT